MFVATAVLMLSSCALSRKTKGPIVREGPAELAARATAPFPSEIEDETEASLLACGGAAAAAQNALLERILFKKTASGKPLYEAEIPRIDLQKRIRTVVKNAQVMGTSIKDKTCTVTVVIPKTEIRPILREAK